MAESKPGVYNKLVDFVASKQINSRIKKIEQLYNDRVSQIADQQKIINGSAVTSKLNKFFLNHNHFIN